MNVKEIVSQNRNKLIVIVSALIVLTLCFIWGHSLMPVKSSLNESGYFYKMLKPIIDSIIGPNIFSDYILRKFAHFSEFFILGGEFIILMSLLMKKPCNKPTYLFLNSWFLGIFCAVIDETIQIFTGRGSKIMDVWLDSTGCLCGIIIIGLIIFYIYKKLN